ncbi:tellurium resistance protein TerD [Novimethylophilus kurashikiensis]|uniref:Tellurium resistance protein TerD n=1 Tax=Novimethylophilus kurashikiensis TaxID=1825523 RepID=A0A2R5F8B5_9PROT|nr:TerD family protein [Novimethylophilus kurashikiensis]GBG14275.1 tellurium resistance protein TerD [Novimethylophilus kurashikiensis]
MAMLELNLLKQGEDAPKLSLSLDKGERFKVRLSWEGDTDLDLHGLLAINVGHGAKVSSFGDILSTYNVKRTIRGQTVGTLEKSADGTFEIHGGALTHSPDALEGDSNDGDDEWILINPDRLTPPQQGAIEIPLVAMIHPQNAGRTFRNVKNARVIVENSTGEELLNVSLSDQFGEFVGVQMGSIMVEPSGSSFVGIGVGFNSDFNQVLAHFS